MTATDTRSRDELVRDAYPLVALEARRFRGYPPGVSAEDLESLGGELLLCAAAEYGGPPDGWRKFAKFYLRNRMRDFCRTARARAARSAPIDVLVREPGGEPVELPREDRRQADPADLAAAREPLVLAKRPRATLSTRRLAETLPSPAEVAEQVTRLRAALFSAVSEQDVSEVMAGVVARAKGGSARDVKLLLDLLAPSRSGVTVNQAVQTVIVQPDDLS